MENIFLQKNTNGTFTIVSPTEDYKKSGFCGELIPFDEITNYFNEKEDPGEVKNIYFCKNIASNIVCEVLKKIPKEFYVVSFQRLLPCSVYPEYISGVDGYYFYGAETNLKTTNVIYAITGEEVLNILNDHALYDAVSTDIFSFKTFVKLQDIIKKDATIVASFEISKNKESFAKLMSYLKIDKEIIF